jgi:hypothetical protein
MKFLCRALCVLFLAVGFVRAADEEEDPETFGDYAPTLDDDLIQYVPKYTVRVGFRDISGVKSGFGGRGFLTSADPGAATGVAARTYHDGHVGLDTRTVMDPAGRTVAITPDGRTNNWSFTTDTQVGTGSASGLIEMHAYTAQVTDSATHEKDPGSSLGVEMVLERDFGKLLRTRMHWGVVGGVSMNQFAATSSANTPATITKTTDYYSLNGQTPPAAPYTAPSFSGSADTSVLLGNTILTRVATQATSADAVLTSWHLRGAYMTFRGGPTLTVPIGSHFTANLSAGMVLVYSGSSYTVVQNFRPETGDVIADSNSDGSSTLRPGFYVDANVQWDMTDTAGLYLGGVYQNSGEYTQTVTSADGKSTYYTRVDLSKLQGFRAGVSFKF